MLQLKKFLPYYKYLKPVRWKFALGIFWRAFFIVEWPGLTSHGGDGLSCPVR